MFPLARNCFVFEEGDGNLNFGDNLSGVVVIPSLMGNKKLYIGTLLADLCSNVLGEFGVVVRTFNYPNNKLLRLEMTGSSSRKSSRQ